MLGSSNKRYLSSEIFWSNKDWGDNRLLLEIDRLDEEETSRVRTLYLTHNRLVCPMGVERFSGLRRLFLSKNRMEELSLSLPPLLEELDVCDNQLSHLPTQLAQLTSLRRLWLRHNRFTLAGVALLSRLTGLEWTDLSGNPELESLGVGLRTSDWATTQVLLLRITELWRCQRARAAVLAWMLVSLRLELTYDAARKVAEIVWSWRQDAEWDDSF